MLQVPFPRNAAVGPSLRMLQLVLLSKCGGGGAILKSLSSPLCNPRPHLKTHGLAIFAITASMPNASSCQFEVRGHSASTPSLADTSVSFLKGQRPLTVSGTTVWIKIIIVSLENLFPPNYRYRYHLEIRMNFHYRYRLGVRSHPFISIDSQLPSWK